MKKLLFSLTVICLITMSCEQESHVVPEQSQVELLTLKAIASEEFQNLTVSTSSLDIENSQFANTNESSILIPFKGIDDKKGIIALFNDNYKIKTVASYNVQTETPTDQIYDKLKEGTFSGQFTFVNEDIQVNLDMESSKIISTKSKYMNNIGRTTECNNITEPGGAADCAGARLEDMNWFEAGLCYTRFMICMAELTISCWIDDCVV